MQYASDFVDDIIFRIAGYIPITSHNSNGVCQCRQTVHDFRMSQFTRYRGKVCCPRVPCFDIVLCEFQLHMYLAKILPAIFHVKMRRNVL